MIPLFPGNAEEERILKLLAASFRLSSDEFGYEIKLREALTEIWLMFFELSRSIREKKGEHNKSNDKIKLMIYIIVLVMKDWTKMTLAVKMFIEYLKYRNMD